MIRCIITYIANTSRLESQNEKMLNLKLQLYHINQNFNLMAKRSVFALNLT